MSRYLCFVFLLLFISCKSICQVTGHASASNPYGADYHQATFPGGQDSLVAFVKGHLDYSREAKKSYIEGRVIISFMVDVDGALYDVKVKRRIHPLCDDEALRVVNLMPKWIPATYKGEPKRSMVLLPVVFKLE